MDITNKALNSRHKSLEALLIENKDKLSISRNGFISVNMQSAETQKSIKKQLDKLEKLESFNNLQVSY
jgi:hypothetical protein